MKLKTLREIEINQKQDLDNGWSSEFQGFIKVKDLRQEAIKHIKELGKEIEEIKTIPEVYQEYRKNPILLRGEVCHTIRWIKWYFNITEDMIK